MPYSPLVRLVQLLDDLDDPTGYHPIAVDHTDKLSLLGHRQGVEIQLLHGPQSLALGRIALNRCFIADKAPQSR